MILYIKYMVSLRCKMVVKSELEKLGFTCILVELGRVEVEEDISKELLGIFNKNLKVWGLELLEGKKNILVENIKCIIIEMIHNSDEVSELKYSIIISQKMKYGYNYLSSVFLEIEGINIQEYIILHKIEKVKEMLSYNEHTLSEIAYKLHYSSIAHLSNQFKKVTGLTPTFYKKIKEIRNTNLEDI